MNRTLQIKIVIIALAVLGSLYSLWPTLRLARGTGGMSKEQVDSYKARAVKRGLDLQGGMYLVLEVDKSQLDEQNAADAIDRVIEILRNRIDQFGVSEPVIQKEGTSRIVVQLPGLQDAERAKVLIGSTARLEFHLVREGAEVSNLVQRLDRVLAGIELPDSSATDSTQGAADEAGTAEAGEDSLADSDLLAGLPEDAALASEDEIDPQHPLASMLGPYLPSYGGIPVAERFRDRVDRLLARKEAQRVIPRDVSFHWGAEKLPAQGGGQAYLLYLIENDVSLAGDELQTAVVTPDPDRPPRLMVSLTLTRRGGLRFANVTGANVGRKLAIVLDGVVNSAPNIRSKISGGRASISGGFATDEEARDLALMLRAGALPVDVSIAEERTVGPSLGADSIRQGIRSVLLGGLFVVVFMWIYYRGAGFLATLGLLITLMTLMGILAQLHLTLTLPGIAGIILTIGMAVDANVLIFERIREELRAGKTVRAAIDAGYAQATRAIVDANITTFIAAVVLFYFGTGPIKGFAVTLSIGILTSMFSALVFTRTWYEIWLRGRQPSRLSI